jgi:PPOX class probable F420-dependent enzyme
MVPDRARIGRMNLDEARDVIRTQHRAVLSTMRRDGTPQMSPVTVNIDAEGKLIISSRQTAYKVRNLRRDPRAWVCVMPDTFFGRWISVEGTATIVELPEAMELLVDYYRRTSGEHPDWADYRAAMERDERVLVRIELAKAGPDREG